VYESQITCDYLQLDYHLLPMLKDFDEEKDLDAEKLKKI